MIKVEADGYLPQAIRFPGKDSEISDLILTRGSGPSGTVLAPDGTPAIGAGLMLIGAGYNQASMNSKGELMSFGGSSKIVKAGSIGEFVPEAGMGSIAGVGSLDERLCNDPTGISGNQSSYPNGSARQDHWQTPTHVRSVDQ